MGCDILLEDGSRILLEDGSGAVVQDGCTPTGGGGGGSGCDLLLESGSRILLEDGVSALLQDGCTPGQQTQPTGGTFVFSKRRLRQIQPAPLEPFNDEDEAVALTLLQTLRTRRIVG